MSHTEVNGRFDSSHASRHVRRNTLIFIILLALLGAGGWWAYQNGLLAQGMASNTPAAAVTLTDDERQAGQVQTGLAQTPNTDTFPARRAGTPLSGNPPAGAPPAAASGDTTTTAALPTPDAAATAAATAPVTVLALAGVEGAQLWATDGVLLATLDSGDSLTAIGRSEDNGWLAVLTEAGAGWVQSRQLIAYGVQKLPASAAPADVLAAISTAAETAAAPAVQASVVVATSPATVEAAGAGQPEAARETAAATAPALAATVTISDARLNVRSGPGTGYAVVAKAAPQADLTVVGRSEEGAWLQVQLPDDTARTGWVSVEFVTVEGDISLLPVPATSPAPAETAGVTLVTIAARTSDPATAAPLAVVTADGQLEGTLVFQQHAGGAIQVYDFKTGTLRQLTYGFDPAISPDGSSVAFVREGGENGLYLVDIDGSNERLIFSEHSSLSTPKWSPDGQWILFSRNDEYVECYDVGFNQCLEEDEVIKRFPNEDPASFPLVKEYTYKLAAVDTDGNNFHDIPTLNSARAADWSEGGIVYQSKAGLQRTADAEGAVNQEIAFDNLKPFYFDPDWQPGGWQIVFQMKGAAQYDLYVVNPDGSGMAALTRPVTTLVDKLPSNVAPAYSPDGQHIVFLSSRSDDNSAGAWRLWVMDADGSNQQLLPIDVEIEYNERLEQVVSWGQ